MALFLLSSLKNSIGLLCHILPAYNPFGSALSNSLMELESALFCFYWIKIGRKMDSVHKLWALLKIGPPRRELRHTWLLCLSPAGLWIGLAMCFCLCGLFCLVVLWISIWFFLCCTENPSTAFGFGSQQSERAYWKQSLGTNLMGLVNRQWGIYFKWFMPTLKKYS